jgi:gliding motility-associated-like protein
MQKTIVTLLFVAYLLSGFAFAQSDNSFTYNFIEAKRNKSNSVVQFYANAPRGASSFMWSFGQNNATSTEMNPVFEYSETDESVFIVTLFYEGLAEPISKVIDIRNLSNNTKAQKAAMSDFVDIPNVFTPNGDGDNDFFIFETPEASRLSIKIFSRSGSVVYEKEANLIHWDGKNYYGQDLADGIYYYVIVDLDGQYNPAKGFFYIYR